jgi:hypothetical protein
MARLLARGSGESEVFGQGDGELSTTVQQARTTTVVAPSSSVKVKVAVPHCDWP